MGAKFSFAVPAAPPCNMSVHQSEAWMQACRALELAHVASVTPNADGTCTYSGTVDDDTVNDLVRGLLLSGTCTAVHVDAAVYMLRRGDGDVLDVGNGN